MAGSYMTSNDNSNAFLLNDDQINSNNKPSRFANRLPLYPLQHNETVKNIVNNDIMKRFKHLNENTEDERNFHTANRFSYSYIFANICRLRFKYLIMRFLVTFSVIVITADYLFMKSLDLFDRIEYSDNSSYLIIKFLKLSSRFVALYGSFLSIELTRKNYLHVSFKSSHFLKSFQKFVKYQAVYIASFLLLSISLGFFNRFYEQFETKTLAVLSLISLTGVYTTKHLFCGNDRLVFSQGTEFYQNPQLYIKVNCYKKLINSLTLSASSVLGIFGLYVLTVKVGLEFFYQLIINNVFWRFAKYLFVGKQKQSEYINNMMILNGYYGSHYNSEDLKYLASRSLNKNDNTSSVTSDAANIAFLTFKQLINLFVLNAAVFFIWEILNISFNAYLSIGPLHKGKLISLSSPRPIDTLIDGLRNKNSFARLTAFQELSLRSQLKLKGNLVENIYRNPIYNNKSNWSNILKECLKIINETNNNIVEYNLKINIKKDNEAYLNKLMAFQKNKNLEKLLKLQENERLFGNSLSPIDDLDLVTLNNEYLAKKDQIWRDNFDNVNNNILNAYDDEYIHGISQENRNKSRQLKEFHSNIQKDDDSYLNDNVIIKYVYPSIKRFFNKNIKKFLFPDVAKPVISLQPELNTSYDTKLNKLFRVFLARTNIITKSTVLNHLYVKYTNYLLEKDAQEICTLPTAYAESVFAMCSLLIRSLEENPRSYVVSSINEILKTYQISSVILSEYCDLVNQERGYSKSKPTGIEILYDIVLAAFLEVVVKYNSLLKDIELDDDVKDLIKCVLE